MSNPRLEFTPRSIQLQSGEKWSPTLQADSLPSEPPEKPF